MSKMIGGITQTGLNLMQQALGENKPLTFVTIHLGSGTPSSSDFGQLTRLVEEKLSIPTYKTYYLTPQTVQTSGHLTLQDITTDFVYHELGLYAQVGADMPQLYAYFYKEEGESIKQTDLVERTLTVETFVDKAVNLTVTIDNSVEWINKKEFNGHTDDNRNPHATTKAHVGLGNVENLPLATLSDINNDVVSNAYMTHSLTDTFVTKALAKHLKEDNPHQLSKSSIGLDSVQNYPIATQEEVLSDSLPSYKYTTPQLVDLQTLNKILTGAYLLSSFTDYHKLLTKEGLTVGPNLSLIETEKGIRLTYTGSTQVGTVSWNDIISGNFASHPDVQGTLATYLKSVTSTDRSVTITKNGNKVDLSVNFKNPTFKSIEGDPTSNQLLTNLLNSKLSHTQIFNSDDIIKEQLSDGNICFKLRNTNKVITWADITGQPSSNMSLVDYIKSLSFKPETIGNYIKAGSNVSITRNSDNTITINSAATSTGGTGGTGTTTVTFANIQGSPSDNSALSTLLQSFVTVQDLLKVNTYIGEINTKLGEVALPTNAKTITGAIAETFQSVSKGKQLVASAITDKGISTNPTDTFTTMATNIKSISTGAEVPQWNLKLYEHFVLDKEIIDGCGRLATKLESANLDAYVFLKHLGYNSYEHGTLNFTSRTYKLLQSHLGYLLYRVSSSASEWIIYNIHTKKFKTFVNVNYTFNYVTSNGLYALGFMNNSAVIKLNLSTGEITTLGLYSRGFTSCNDTFTHFMSEYGQVYFLSDSTFTLVSLDSYYPNLGFSNNYYYAMKSSDKSGQQDLYQITLSGTSATSKLVKTVKKAILSHDTLFCIELLDDGTSQVNSYDSKTLSLLVKGKAGTSSEYYASGPNQVAMYSNYHEFVTTRTTCYETKLRSDKFTAFNSRLFADNGLFYYKIDTTEYLRGKIENNVAVPSGYYLNGEVKCISPNGLHGIFYSNAKSKYYHFNPSTHDNFVEIPSYLATGSYPNYINNAGDRIWYNYSVYKLENNVMSELRLSPSSPMLVDRNLTRFVSDNVLYYYNGTDLEKTYTVDTLLAFPYYKDTTTQELVDASDKHNGKAIGRCEAGAFVVHDYLLSLIYGYNTYCPFSTTKNPSLLTLMPFKSFPVTANTTRITDHLSIYSQYTLITTS